MYDLGNQFRLNISNGICNAESIIKGEKYRFSLLSERLIRFEYSETGKFCDNLTPLVMNRKFDIVKYHILQNDDKSLIFETPYFTVEYQKNKPFKGTNAYPGMYLRVVIKQLNTTWFYQNPEVKNFKGNFVSLDNFDGRLNMEKGLYSQDGFASIDDTDSLIFDDNGTLAPRTDKEIDVYLFAYKKDFALCLKDYFNLTGYPPLIPRYALGNWWSKNDVLTSNDIIKTIERFKKEEIPISIFMLDKSYKKEGTNYTFDNNTIPDVRALTDYIHKNNIVCGINIEPQKGITQTDEFYKEVSKYLETINNIIPFNVYNPRFIDVYLKVLIHSLENKGFDFFWIDYLPERKKLMELFILNHYHFRDRERVSRIRPLILSRSSMTAQHRYPVCYSGRTISSFETLKNLPFINSSASNIGISFWSHDISGFHKGIEDNELYLRSVQLGVFSPILRFSANKGKYYKKEPWKMDFKTLEITKNYLMLRHQLIPYIYSESYKYHKTGAPLVQPIYYLIPEMYDDNKIKNQYFFGSELLVSPIVRKKDKLANRVVQRFYLPDGVWFDFTTGKKFSGNREYISFYKDEDYPVFAKAGSIIPLGINDNINSTASPNTLEVQIFPGNNNTYYLYEDDGITTNYMNGFYLVTQIDYKYSPNDYTIIVKPYDGRIGVVNRYRNYLFRLRNVKQTDNITVYMGNGLKDYNSFIDENDFIIQIDNVDTSAQLTVNCKGNNLEIEALKLINDDIDDILLDVSIETEIKEKISNIMFGDLPMKKKRIEIKKLKKLKVEETYIKLFTKLLEYVLENEK